MCTHVQKKCKTRRWARNTLYQVFKFYSLPKSIRFYEMTFNNLLLLKETIICLTIILKFS